MLKKRFFLKVIIITIVLPIVLPLGISVQAIQEVAPEITAESAIVMDMDTNEVIYSKNPEVIRPIASTTKLMTALLFAEHKKKNDIIKFTTSSLKITETSLNNYKKIKEGDEISAEDLMEAALVFSANDSAYLMAESIEGNIPNFVNMMNSRSKSLGLKNTHFSNPSGLEVDFLNKNNTSLNESTAYDLAVIATESFKNPWVKEILTNKDTSVINFSGSLLRVESNTRNKIIGQNGNLGGKTGTEEKAGHCFVGFYNKNGRNLVSVVLKSEDDSAGMNVFNDTNKIIDYASNLKKVPYKKANEVVLNIELECKVYGSFGQINKLTVPVLLSDDIEYYKNELNNKYIKIQYNDEKDPWKLIKNNNISLTLSELNSTSDIKGIVDISIWKIIKANILIYIKNFIFVIILLCVLLYGLRIYNLNKRKKRRKKRLNKSHSK